MKVFGIDIIKGSVRSKTKKPVFALVKREDNEEKDTSEVSMFRLKKELEKEKPDILAVDSIREISSEKKELLFFMQSLPAGTKLVQVTGGEKQQKLPRIAAQYNIRLSDRFDPFQEAKACAHVAELGAGCEVIAFENTCDIIVSKSRSIGKGGWSQNRYIRKIHGAVLSKSREIEDTLKEKGLKYKKTEVKGFGGYKRVSFHVFASKTEISVQSERHADFQVRVIPRELDKIRYSPQTARKRPLIVGIDPGTTFAFAALYLDGEVASVKSSRQMSISDWTEEISSIGKPVLIASDVVQMPSSVEKIRRSFNAVSYTPKQEKTQEEKASLCISAGLSFRNDHERDSLSAAIEAYKSYKNKFRSVERRIPPGFSLDEIRAGIIKGQSIEQILSKDKDFVLREDGEEKSDISVTEFSDSDGRVSQLEGMIKDLRSHVSELSLTLNEKNEEIIGLKNLLASERTQKSEERKKSRDIAERDLQIKTLKARLKKQDKDTRRLLKRISRLKRFNSLWMEGDYIPVKVLPALTKEAVKALEDEFGITEGDIIYAAKTEGWGKQTVSYISDCYVSGIIADNFDKKLLNCLREENVPLILAVKVPVSLRGRTGTIKKDDFDRAVLEWKEEQITYEAEKKADMIEAIVKEYKSERELEARRRG